MNIIIYESGSFGGCYDYVQQIFKHYSRHRKVNTCQLLLPVNAYFQGNGVHRILASDISSFKHHILKKAYFIYRSLINPFILLAFLRKQPVSIVIFNTFEQATAIIWVPIFKFFLRKHQFAVILHDPDRDAYPPSRAFSAFSMRKMMELMDFALFHDVLPQKSYYLHNTHTRYISIPHGVYPPSKPDSEMLGFLFNKKDDTTIFAGILGNIRPEKNYHLAIQVLKRFPKLKLIIAGAPAHSGVNVKNYERQAYLAGVAEQIIWITKFLSQAQMSAVIEACDIILLNYSKTFTSQSGILNIIAPFRKNILYSAGDSSLAEMAKKYNLGVGVEVDDVSALEQGIGCIMKMQQSNSDWDAYLKYASWESNVAVAIEAFCGTR